MTDLPPGFVLDQQRGIDLPPGFVLDPQRTAGQELDRKAALGVQGARVGVLNTIGAPVDLLAAGMRELGLPVNNPVGGSQSLNAAADWVASLPGKIAPGMFSDGKRLTPETTAEKAIHGAGEAVGSAATTMLPAGALARSLPRGTLGQGLAETMAAQPAMQTASAAAGGAVSGATDNPYLGLAAALAFPAAVGGAARVVSPMGPARTAAETERRRLVDVLREQGVPLTPGQTTGNRGIQIMESVMESLPGSGGMQRALNNRQREAFNRAVTATTGDPVPAFTQAERQARRADLGQTFERLASGTTVNLDQPFVTQLDDALTRYRQQLPPDVYRNVEQRLESLIGAATQPGNPQIPGDIYQRIRSSLSRQATNMGDREAAGALREMRNALDGAARRSLPADVAQEWDTVRRQWANLRTIENSMRNADAAVGDIAPRALGQAVDTANRRGASRDLTDLAAGGRRIVADQIANSGTPSRLFWQNLVTGGGIGGTAYGATGSPTIAAVSLLAPVLAQAATQNPATRAWAANRIAGNVATLPTSELAGKISLAQVLANMPETTGAVRRRGARQ